MTVLVQPMNKHSAFVFVLARYASVEVALLKSVQLSRSFKVLFVV